MSSLVNPSAVSLVIVAEVLRPLPRLGMRDERRGLRGASGAQIRSSEAVGSGPVTTQEIPLSTPSAVVLARRSARQEDPNLTVFGV